MKWNEATHRNCGDGETISPVKRTAEPGTGVALETAVARIERHDFALSKAVA
jgi:hypothetical protein